MVAVFREVWRVLRDDGTAWVNMGDSYAGGAGGRGDIGNVIAGHQTRTASVGNGRIRHDLGVGLKPKDLCAIPWRLALALQADGWYLRSDIIWSKPNPMPESVTDRPTKSHEYLFLLAKRERYFFDAEAVREAHKPESLVRYKSPQKRCNKSMHGQFGRNTYDGAPSSCTDMVGHESGRNIRSVWSIATESYPGAHFATFPRRLVEPCIKAGTSERGVCPAIVPKLRLKTDLPPERREQVMRYLKSKRLVT